MMNLVKEKTRKNSSKDFHAVFGTANYLYT